MATNNPMDDLAPPPPPRGKAKKKRVKRKVGRPASAEEVFKKNNAKEEPVAGNAESAGSPRIISVDADVREVPDGVGYLSRHLNAQLTPDARVGARRLFEGSYGNLTLKQRKSLRASIARPVVELLEKIGRAEL